MAVRVSVEQVIAHRLRAHHLDERLGEPAGPMTALGCAAGACGVQDSPPGSALLSLHARVRGVTRERFDAALGTEKSLLGSWCMRGAPYFFPTADLAVFTAGVLPADEAALRHFLPGAVPSVDRLGMSLDALADLAAAEVPAVLRGRRLAIGDLGRELAERLAEHLTADQQRVWWQEGPHAAGQPVGEALVHFCVRILTCRGIVCFAPRQDKTQPFILVEDWLGADGCRAQRDAVGADDFAAARTELARRYLHCYGPSTRADFASWLGVRTGDVGPWWDGLSDELTQVDFGRRTWMLEADVEALAAASLPEPGTGGVRLLPPHDPYTQARDRSTILDKGFHRQMWKPVGDPGAVLVDGRIVGIWRPRKAGRRLQLKVSEFAPLSPEARQALRTEAECIAVLRGASAAVVEFDA
ncbi:winged helix DNA-binding domain-containing protein [Brevibacterium sp. 50QC2O2]|uniref:winged helix DNA-binding domain-containing protein n=1 Tax=Brevibacterium sp. 50QC2O2 TaxID=2968459 RepID=UPI00211BCE61|nr:winged helix DNA-binding domain-containing protein [Brevibacterium sp. 50QC2O2]MCQ9389531.1 winged helix DNA-binding domain-containing protein [Brevibacterium sp. 50QC2O2]